MEKNSFQKNAEEEILKHENVPTELAAKYLGVSTQFVRIGLQKERLPFGCAVQVNDKPNGKWTYQISPYALINYYKKGKAQ